MGGLDKWQSSEKLTQNALFVEKKLNSMTYKGRSVILNRASIEQQLAASDMLMATGDACQLPGALVKLSSFPIGLDLLGDMSGDGASRERLVSSK